MLETGNLPKTTGSEDVNIAYNYYKTTTSLPCQKCTQQ